MADNDVEDIIMNRPNEVFIRRGSKTTCHEVPVDFVDQQGIAILAAMALVVRPPRRRRGAPQHHTEPPVVQVDPAWATRFGTDRML